MTKQQETNGLKKVIERSEIYQTIDLLERKLNYYRDSKKVWKKTYQFNSEFDLISKALTNLKYRIKDLLEKN